MDVTLSHVFGSYRPIMTPSGDRSAATLAPPRHTHRKPLPPPPWSGLQRAYLAVGRVLDGAVHGRAEHEQPRHGVAQVLDVEVEERRVPATARGLAAQSPSHPQTQAERQAVSRGSLSMLPDRQRIKRVGRSMITPYTTHFCASLTHSGTPERVSNSANVSDERTSLSPRPSWKNCVERATSRLSTSTCRSRIITSLWTTWKCVCVI